MIQQKLKSNATQATLKTLLKYSNKYPYLLRDWITNVSNYKHPKESFINKAITYNETMVHYVNQSQAKMNEIIGELLLDHSGSSKLMRRMAVIDRSATAWITLLRPIKLDIFYGFPSEKALTDYYMNISKQENFKKYVFSGRYPCKITPEGMLEREGWNTKDICPLACITDGEVIK